MILVEKLYKSLGKKEGGYLPAWMSFGRKREKNEILVNINLELKPGKIYGLIGRNGSGKTMLMRHLCGLMYPDRGTVLINGKKLEKGMELPERMGILIESPGFLPQYSGFRNLKYLADMNGIASVEDIRQAIRTVGLDPDSSQKVGQYSMGMRQRLGIAQALMEDPPILLLDEPMNGLDNEGVEQMRKVLISQRDKGKLIIIASHSKEDIDHLCDEIIRFDHGKLIDYHQ